MPTITEKVHVTVEPYGPAYSREFNCLTAAKVYAESLEVDILIYASAISITQDTSFQNVLTGDIFTTTRSYYVEDSTDRCEFHSNPKNGEACNLLSLREQERLLAKLHVTAP